MEDLTPATFSYGGQRKIRGLRRVRGSGCSWARVIRALLVSVCALSLVGGIMLAGELASSKWESGGIRLGLAGRKLPSGQVFRASNDELAESQSFDVSPVKQWHQSGEPLQSNVEALRLSEGNQGTESAKEKANKRLVSRIGFGSCTSRVAIDQPIWVNGVISSDIDAWIWCTFTIKPLLFPQLDADMLL